MRVKKIFLRAIALALLMAFVPSACAPAPTDAQVPAEELKSFIGLNLNEAGTVKTVPGSTYALGQENLPGGYIFEQVDDKTISINCKGLIFKFVDESDRDDGRKMVLPGGQTLGFKPKFEVQTTSCHFTIEFPLAGGEYLTVYK